MALRSASAVIGSAFGDEGKGLMTDYIAATLDGPCTVVRFNGGAQAGHTVQTLDGRRHVFHQFGSGALAGAATHLSRFFVANPVVFQAEREALQAMGANTSVTISGDALITTPWDMFANTESEMARGLNRHGSCGLGIGETVGRQEETPFGLQVKDLGAGDLRDRLVSIRGRWLPERLSRLGVDADPARRAVMLSDGLLERFIEDLEMFSSQVMVMDIAEALEGKRPVFEGAQGLLLDQNAGAPWFPNVTRSNTGLRNILRLSDEAGIKEIDVTYMARAYLTRHGAGPLPFEYEHKPHEGISDPTNVPNAWQGNLRFAPFNLDLLSTAINRDLTAARLTSGIRTVARVCVTCLDQIETRLDVVEEGRVRTISSDEMISLAANVIPGSSPATSYGATRVSVSR